MNRVLIIIAAVKDWIAGDTVLVTKGRLSTTKDLMEIKAHLVKSEIARKSPDAVVRDITILGLNALGPIE